MILFRELLEKWHVIENIHPFKKDFLSRKRSSRHLFFSGNRKSPSQYQRISQSGISIPGHMLMKYRFRSLSLNIDVTAANELCLNVIRCENGQINFKFYHGVAP